MYSVFICTVEILSKKRHNSLQLVSMLDNTNYTVGDI